MAGTRPAGGVPATCHFPGPRRHDDGHGTLTKATAAVLVGVSSSAMCKAFTLAVPMSTLQKASSARITTDSAAQ